MQLVFFQNRDGFGGCSFGGVLAALVVHDGQRSIGRDGMELLGNQQVDIFVVLLERSKAVGIPAYEKYGSHRIISCRELSDVRHSAVPAFASSRFLLRLDGAISGLGIRQETRG